MLGIIPIVCSYKPAATIFMVEVTGGGFFFLISLKYQSLLPVTDCVMA
jgi:hypothetical protein